MSPIRIGPTTNEERNFINLLTTEERRSTLVLAGKDKAMSMVGIGNDDCAVRVNQGDTILIGGVKYRIGVNYLNGNTVSIYRES